MNPPKCDDLDYIHFLIAAQKVFTCMEAARCQPEYGGVVAGSEGLRGLAEGAFDPG
jgi:hypothetical protein